MGTLLAKAISSQPSIRGISVRIRDGFRPIRSIRYPDRIQPMGVVIDDILAV